MVLCSLCESQKEKAVDLGILYLFAFLLDSNVNVSESIWKQRCIFIRELEFMDKIT